MDNATYKKLILNVLYGKHKNFPDDKLDECIKEFDTNIRELEEELACKKQTLIDLRNERARRNINNKFGLKIDEINNCTKELQRRYSVYADIDCINSFLQREEHKNPTDNKYYDPKRAEELRNSVIKLTPHCKSCIYYDKLLNVCFVNNPDWKQVWDETEACEKWTIKIPD